MNDNESIDTASECYSSSDDDHEMAPKVAIRILPTVGKCAMRIVVDEATKIGRAYAGAFDDHQALNIGVIAKPFSECSK